MKNLTVSTPSCVMGPSPRLGHNPSWNDVNFIQLAAYALWRITSIHPFVNGNGRTARSVCYFVLCGKSNGLLPGKDLLPELLANKYRPEYTVALRQADQGKHSSLIDLVGKVANEQVASA
ncbi:MAG: Fic family protein [Rhodobacteraceae bacterium]|nr:Fic family protein [Paracoccaceae bacterium]